MSFMSFLENMQSGYDEENEKIQNRMSSSNYKTQYELEQEREYENFKKLSMKGDGDLIRQLRRLPDSSDDRDTIKSILVQRGYKETKDGNFRRM
jgi:hypothetical protein